MTEQINVSAVTVHCNQNGTQDGYKGMLQALKDGHVAMSIEVKASGTRYWATAPNPLSLMRLVGRLDPVPAGMDPVDPQFSYEVINPDAPFCLYLDVEDDRPTRDNNDIFSKTIEILQETLCETFGEDIDTRHICVDACNDGKASRHYIYPAVIFDNLISTKAFMLKVTNKIDADDRWSALRWPYDNEGKLRVYPWVIDTSVLSRFRCFRLAMCRKRKANSTPLSVLAEESTYPLKHADQVLRALEATSQWRLRLSPDANTTIRTIDVPVLAMNASKRKNPNNSIPIHISSIDWTSNVFIQTAWREIEGERWWPNNRKTVKTTDEGRIDILIYASKETPAFCPLKCYYVKRQTDKKNGRWQPSGKVEPDHCHDNSGHVRIRISGYVFIGCQFLSVTSYCYRGCYGFLKNLGFNGKLKDFITFPNVPKKEENNQRPATSDQKEPVEGKIEKNMNNTEEAPENPQLS